MMREQVAPALRGLGIKGSGQSFAIPSERYWALIGFQKSRRSSSAVLEFTVNLTVVSRAAWAAAFESHPWIGEKPRPNVRAAMAEDEWHSRIGTLLASRRDRWWSVAADRPTEPVAREVVDVIRDVGLPAMRERMS
jgi:hypothetical protein